ncbi:type II secretion system minor pseudopilin GspK [Zobellella sp. DQSA1]|uniref:type II secretion system minor pseudopilin GspK n=1 Tax=Zobellella sp. DQSA1 TaxID=3342386 RepID=UPI0035C19363
MKGRQRGVALLVVLLIVALMTMLAINLTERSGRAYLSTAGHLARQQAKWYALAAEAMAGQMLLSDGRDSPNSTHLAQLWAQEGRQFPVEGGEIGGQITDAQACFNLNAINQVVSYVDQGEAVEAAYPAQVFHHLLLQLGVEAERAGSVTDALRDWVDNDGAPREKGAEDEAYASLNPPYLPANRALVDVSELRMVLGIDTALYRRLLPYVCVLPQQALLININTLQLSQAALLSALFLNEVSRTAAAQLLDERPREGWSSVPALLAQGALPELNSEAAKQVLTVNSQFFFARISVRLADGDYHRHSLLQREGSRINVLQRHDGLSMKVEP